jgi:hypothetical protein
VVDGEILIVDDCDVVEDGVVVVSVTDDSPEEIVFG